MKKVLLLLAAVMLLSACETVPPVDTDPTTDGVTTEPVTEEVTTVIELPEVKPLEIHKISQLNTTVYPLDSAAGEEKNSTLVSNYRESYTLEPGDMGGVKAYYTRIKKVDDSNYIMTFHNTRLGGSVYCMRSTDCKNWSKPVVVMNQKVISVNGKQDNLKYMTPDSFVLDDGRIMIVASYRAEKAYQTAIGENGLVACFSSDMGKTWTEPQIIYKGTNWEPCALQVDTGEIYVYFSCTAPSILEHGFDLRSSGVGMIRSKDGGKTWTPNVTEAPWMPQYVMRCYVCTMDGVKRYNDQMPVAIQLNNGTIALAVETHNPSNNAYKFSISYNNDGYLKDVGMDTTGPDNRKTNLFNLAGPYLCQFDSGEVVLTYHWSGKFNYRLANSTATEFYDAVTIWDDTEHWGASEKLTSHSAAFTICTEDFKAKVTTMYLNHRVNANRLTPTLTATTSDWDGSTDAIFLGADSQAQVSVRLAHDDDYIYLLGERLDYFVTDNDKLVVYFHDGKTGQYMMTLTNDDIKVERRESIEGKNVEVSAEELGIKYHVAVDGLANDILSDMDNGIVYELAFPKSLIDIKDGEIAYRVKLVNRDSSNGKTNTEDSNKNAGMNNTDGWSKADLK
ncbi:MAG: exo-alpha-sialidase [Ruminococcaceae bacterium]|nr:exo-alpha-sialidase [Oscillospiraceae bacterium]